MFTPQNDFRHPLSPGFCTDLDHWRRREKAPRKNLNSKKPSLVDKVQAPLRCTSKWPYVSAPRRFPVVCRSRLFSVIFFKPQIFGLSIKGYTKCLLYSRRVVCAGYGKREFLMFFFCSPTNLRRYSACYCWDRRRGKEKAQHSFALAYSTTAGVIRVDRITLVVSRNTDLVWNLFLIEPNRKRFGFRLATLAFRYVLNHHVFPLLKTHKRKKNTNDSRWTIDGFSNFYPKRNPYNRYDIISIWCTENHSNTGVQHNLSRKPLYRLDVEYVVPCLICTIAHKRLKIYFDKNKR